MQSATAMALADTRLNQLTWLIIKCAMKVHSALGPGLLESAYVACLIHELREAGLGVERESRWVSCSIST